MFQEKLDILENCLGKYRQSGGEYLFFCPAHEHHKPKLSINLKKNKTKCWICSESFGSIKFFVKKYGSHSDLENWQKVSNSFDFSDLADLDAEAQKIELPAEYKPICTATEIEKFPFQNILKNKKVDDKVVLYKLGFCKTGQYQQRIIVPSFDSKGRLNYFVGRTYSKKSEQKYVAPKAATDIIFNDYLINWSKPIILVENSFDSMIVPNSIPVLGSRISEESLLFSKICEFSDEVIISLDKDAFLKEEKIIKTFREYDIKVSFLQKTKDFTEYTKDGIQEVLENRVESTFEHDFERKLGRIL